MTPKWPNILRSSVLSTVSLVILMILGCGVDLADQQRIIGDDDGNNACEVGTADADELARLAGDLESELGISVEAAKVPCQRLHCNPLDASQGQMAVAMYRTLAEELRRYPRDALQQYGPVKIWLASNLRIPSSSWEAGGVAYSHDRVIYLNVGATCNADVRRAIIHHELYHIFDAHFFSTDAANKQWQKLNPPGFAYRLNYPGGAMAMHPGDGFVTDYAMTNIGEDRAELFRFQVARPFSDYLKSWTSSDPYLRAKDIILRDVVASAWPAGAPAAGASPQYLTHSAPFETPVDFRCGGSY